MKRLSATNQNENVLKNLPEPVDPADAATRQYVDDLPVSPIDHLDRIEILVSFPMNPNLGVYRFPQGVSINEDAGEFYVSSQGNEGGASNSATLTIDKRSLSNGSIIASRNISTGTGTWTEGMPWFYNASNQLCFIVRGVGGASGQYNIYNFDTSTLGASITINGAYSADVDGDFFITAGLSGTSLLCFYLYDWASVKAGTPSLLRTIKVDNAGPVVAKAQGVYLQDGYIILIQGSYTDQPTLTVYNMDGQFIKTVLLDKADFGEAINELVPGSIADTSNYFYENEAGCSYRGKLVTLDVVGEVGSEQAGDCFLVIHNSPAGRKVQQMYPSSSVGAVASKSTSGGWTTYDYGLWKEHVCQVTIPASSTTGAYVTGPTLPDGLTRNDFYPSITSGVDGRIILGLANPSSTATSYSIYYVTTTGTLSAFPATLRIVEK